MSPSALLFGANLKRPGEWTLPAEAALPVLPRDERIARARRRQEVYQRKLFPEPRTAERNYQVGDRVMTRARPGGQPAFGPKWTGPHPILEVLGDAVYMIDQDGNAQAIHLDDIRPAPAPRVLQTRDLAEDEDPAAPPTEPTDPIQTQKTAADDLAESTGSTQKGQYKPLSNIRNSSETAPMSFQPSITPREVPTEEPPSVRERPEKDCAEQRQ